MTTSTLTEDLAELESAEDFLGYFSIPFDQQVIHAYRLHILQRFHDYLHEAADTMPADESAKRTLYADLLQRAYQDFVVSDAQTEKVFKVFHRDEAKEIFIPVSQVLKRE